MHTYMYTIVHIYNYIYVCVCACVCLCIGFNFLRLSRLALNTAWWGSVAAESHVRILKSILIVLAWICHLDAAFDPRWCQWLMVYDGLLLLCHWSTQRTATCRFGVRTHGKMSEELVTSTFEFKLVIYNCKMLSHVQGFLYALDGPTSRLTSCKLILSCTFPSKIQSHNSLCSLRLGAMHNSLAWAHSPVDQLWRFIGTSGAVLQGLSWIVPRSIGTLAWFTSTFLVVESSFSWVSVHFVYSVPRGIGELKIHHAVRQEPLHNNHIIDIPWYG